MEEDEDIFVKTNFARDLAKWMNTSPSSGIRGRRFCVHWIVLHLLSFICVVFFCVNFFLFVLAPRRKTDYSDVVMS